MNAPHTRTAPTPRPTPAVGFTFGSLIELATLGLALLVPAVAFGDDFGPEPTTTARYESNRGRDLFQRPAPTYEPAPAVGVVRPHGPAGHAEAAAERRRPPRLPL